MSDLVELTEIVPNSINWETYEAIIRENSHRRQMITYARHIEQL
jgi:replicative DNA helicase